MAYLVFGCIHLSNEGAIMFKKGKAPAKTVFALKVVEMKGDVAYCPMYSRTEYLDGWMVECSGSKLGFHVPTYDDVLKYDSSWFNHLTSFDYEHNFKLALVEVGVKGTIDDLGSYVFRNMRIVKVYDDTINYENVMKRVKQVKKAHRSIYHNKFKLEFFKRND